MDFHRHTLAKAQQRLREARAELETFKANMSADHPRNDDHLVKLSLMQSMPSLTLNTRSDAPKHCSAPSR
jgi:hypothetical protein